MTMPTSSLGWTLAQRIATLIDASVTVPVHPYWPGDKFIKPVMIWVESWQVEQDYPLSMAGRLRRNEDLTFTIRATVAGYRTMPLALVEAESLVACVESVFVDDTTLGVTGVIDSSFDSHEFTPFSTPDNGVLLEVNMKATVHTRLH